MAKLVLITLGLVVILCLGAMGQVDSLMLRQIGSITCLEAPQNIYFKDMRGNGQLEIIVRTINYIYIYSLIDTTLIWTSPYSYLYDNVINFYDMNNDGDLDISYKDTSGFYIWDPMDSSMIWYDRHLKDYGYTLGDRNSDGIADIIAMKRQLLEMSQTPDTVYVEIYDGPNYQLSGQFNFLVIGYWIDDWQHPYGYIHRVEGPNTIIVSDLTGTNGLERKIVVFTTIGEDGWWADAPEHECSYSSTDGNIKIFDPMNFNSIEINNYGSLSPGANSIMQTTGDSACIYALTQKYSSRVDLGECNDFNSTSKYLLTFSADGLLNSNRFYQYSTYQPVLVDWNGFRIADIDITNPGEEFCFGDRDTLWLSSYPAMSPIWVRPGRCEDGGFSTAIYCLHTIFEHPQIFIHSPHFHDLYDGLTGEPSAIIIGNLPPYLRQVTDIDNDSVDELIWSGGNNIIFCHLELAPTNIDDNNSVPSSFHLYPAYPNPFNPSTTIQYDLVKDSPVNIGIFDILGQRIETLVNQRQPAGHHQVIWNAKDVSSGIYFYKIQAGEYTETKKMVLLK